MAALDFGMALARGMLPTSSAAQRDLLELAGGRNIFKSEDWWNEQVDKQISEGPRKEVSATKYLTQSGDYKLGNLKTIPKRGGGKTYVYEPPSGAKAIGAGKGRRFITQPTKTLVEDRKYFTAAELKDIEKSSDAGAKRAKREAEASKQASKRTRRGTSGLAGRARPVGAGAITGLPELGSGGLQIGATTLGKGLLV